MEFRTVGRPTHGRRSRLDIVGDILRAISEGAEKPTNIMFRANLTWPLTVAYLETLLRHDMVRTEVVGSKLAYKVPPKGSSLLRSFIETEEGAAELGLDKLDPALLARAAARRKPMEEKPMSLEAIRTANEREGYRVLPSVSRGRSGVSHTFDLVMASGGTRLGYIVSEKGAAGDVIRAFILQTDCEMQVQVLCLSPPDEQARALAASYSIAMVPVRREGNG